MRELRLIAVSDDGTQLILQDNESESVMTLPIDERLQAATRGDRARLGQIEQQESKLRPRDIQARVRSGQTVEEVAGAAGVPLEKVQRFAGPVLAERAHVADRAQNAVIRGAATDAPNRPLSEVVGEWVSRSDVDPETVEWDAYRRDDGKWQVVAMWVRAQADHEARFLFDPTGRSAVPDDEEARRIAGLLEPDDEEAEPPAAVGNGQARLSVVNSEREDEPRQLKVAPQLDDEDEQDEQDEHEAPRIPVQGSFDDDQPTAPVPMTAQRSARGRRRGRNPATSERLRLTDIASNVEDDEPAAARQANGADSLVAAEAPKPRGKRNKKPSVPSWDEIMFGRSDRSE